MMKVPPELAFSLVQLSIDRISESISFPSTLTLTLTLTLTITLTLTLIGIIHSVERDIGSVLAIGLTRDTRLS